MKCDLLNYINHVIITKASRLNYTVKSEAPSTEQGLFNSTSLVVWDGASDQTIFGDARVNYAFRALHDKLHLETGIGFSPDEEMHLGRVQASQFEGILADLVYFEVAGQAEYYKKNGIFVPNQVEWTLEQMKGLL